MPFLLNAGAIPVFVSQAAVQQGIEYLNFFKGKFFRTIYGCFRKMAAVRIFCENVK